MKILALSLLALTLSLPAFAESLLCTVKVSTETVSEDRLTLQSGAAAQFGSLDGYRFIVTSLGSDRYELQVYDASVPARNYAEGTLRSSGDVLKWTYWSESSLLEAACSNLGTHSLSGARFLKK